MAVPLTRRADAPSSPFVPRLGRWLWSALRGYAKGELDPGVLAVQKGATTESFEVWVAVVTHGDPDHGDGAESLDAAVTVAGQVHPLTLKRYWLDEGPVRGVPATARFFHHHLRVDGLDADTRYQVRVVVAGHEPVELQARTLRAALGSDRPLRLFAASCYDLGTDPDDKLDRAYRNAFVDPPDLTLLVGDQVYGDAPFLHYVLRSRRNPRAGLLLKYWITWGMSNPPPPTGWRRVRTVGGLFGAERRAGLRGVLSTGPNFFLPDDHEFWNNYPNYSATLKDSYSSLLSVLVDNWRRRDDTLRDPARLAVRPADPNVPPTDPDQRNYLPVHPADRREWSLAAFELFGAFQTRSRADLEGEPTQGAHDARLVGPPDPAAPDLPYPPRNQIVQTVTIDPVTICMLDTRTRRTRRLRDQEHSGFVDEVYLRQMLAAAADAAVFVLVTPQPMLSRAGYTATRDPEEKVRRENSGLFGDVDVHDYWYQWERLWYELLAARDGRPTITIGGDIHQSYLAFAPELSLVEVVASPMSLVWGGNAERLVRWARAKPLDYRAGRAFLPLDAIVMGPEHPTGSHPGAVAYGAGCMAKNKPGFAGLSFLRTSDDVLTLVTELFDRDDVAADPARGPAASARYELRLDGPAAGGTVRALTEG